MTTTPDNTNMADPTATAIRVALAKAGLSNAELARRLGRSGNTGEQWVRRRTHGQVTPSAHDLHAIADALSIDPRELLG